MTSQNLDTQKTPEEPQAPTKFDTPWVLLIMFVVPFIACVIYGFLS